MENEKRKKDPAAVALGKKGADARWKNATDEEKSAAARKRVNARWERVRKERAAAAKKLGK